MPALTCLAVLLPLCPVPQDACALEPETRIIEVRDGSGIRAEYGRVEVPENRADPASRSISVAYVRIETPLEGAGPPVFFLAGGPGGSSIEAVERFVAGGGRDFFALIGGDIVGVDQRGVGRSLPNLDSATLYGFSAEAAGDREQRLEILRRVSREEAARWREQGVDLDGYTTVESADDLEAVRQALGYERISLWGSSYGTHLALATIRRHGDRIARALLVGPEGPDHTVKLPSYAQAGLERIGALVAQDPRLSAEIPDFLALVATVLARLDERPISVEVDGERIGISKLDVQEWIAGQIGLTPTIATLPAVLKAMERGDFEELARELAEERRTSGVLTAMGMVTDAASGMSRERAKLIAEEAEACLLGDSVTYSFEATARAWGVRDLGDEFRGPLRSEVPVLFIVGDLDSRTPVRNARELMQHLPDAHLIVVENTGHDTPLGIPQLRTAWSTFLRGGTVTLERVDASPVRFELPGGVPAARPAGVVALSPAQLAACVGEYEFPGGMLVSVRAGEGRLIVTFPGKGDFDLWPTSEFDYFAENENIPPLTFVRDEGGNVVSMKGGGVEAARRE